MERVVVYKLVWGENPWLGGATRAAPPYFAGDGPNFLLGGAVREYREVVVGSVGTTLPRVMAAVVLLLALVGVYGTTAYATRTRTRGIGIRMALGARAAEVVGRVVGGTAVVVGVGVAVGLLAAGLSSRALTVVLTHAEPGDAGPYAVTGLVVLVAGVVSAWIPAARAGTVDPASTLRGEA